MSEEEKNGIDYLKTLKETGFNKEKLDIVLNLIDKQQKEIEELKVINNMQKYRIEVIDERELISKDKIRELLEKYDKSIAWANADDHYYFVKFINELLEE